MNIPVVIDHEKCAALFGGIAAAMDAEVTLSQVPIPVDPRFAADPITCPHGTTYWFAPTEAQIRQWDEADAAAAKSPTRITFVPWDPETDGVAVKHDGVTVWTERSFDSLAQYLRRAAPLGEPVVIEIEES